MTRRLFLVFSALALLAAVAVVLVPYERELEAIGRNGVVVDAGLSVSCPAPVLGAFESGGGWFNSAPIDGVVEGGGLCRVSARWRLAAGMIGAVSGVVLLRRALSDDDQAVDSATASG